MAHKLNSGGQAGGVVMGLIDPFVLGWDSDNDHHGHKWTQDSANDGPYKIFQCI